MSLSFKHAFDVLSAMQRRFFAGLIMNMHKYEPLTCCSNDSALLNLGHMLNKLIQSFKFAVSVSHPRAKIYRDRPIGRAARRRVT